VPIYRSEEYGDSMVSPIHHPPGSWVHTAHYRPTPHTALW